MKNTFSGIEIVKMKLENSEELLQEVTLQSKLREFEMRELKMAVASQLPSALKSKLNFQENYHMRNLASVVEAPVAELNIDQGSTLFESGKQAFREKKFEGAISKLEKFQAQYTNSSRLPEALFLLSESYFQIGKNESCVRTISSMTEQFPESELTGFALLRLGQIYEAEDRIEDSADIYRLIIQWFENPDLKRQAETALARLENL